jgi:hypothetical protein
MIIRLFKVTGLFLGVNSFMYDVKNKCLEI